MITACPQCGGLRADPGESFAGTPCKCQFVSAHVPKLVSAKDDVFARDLACFLWESSTLRHGLFTPPEFIPIVSERIREYLATHNPNSDSALRDDERLAEIRAEAITETHDGNLDFGHVSLQDVLDWIRIMSPVYSEKVWWAPLMDCDVNSILSTFEEWTQGKHDKELNGK